MKVEWRVDPVLKITKASAVIGATYVSEHDQNLVFVCVNAGFIRMEDMHLIVYNDFNASLGLIRVSAKLVISDYKPEDDDL